MMCDDVGVFDDDGLEFIVDAFGEHSIVAVTCRIRGDLPLLQDVDLQDSNYSLLRSKFSSLDFRVILQLLSPRHVLVDLLSKFVSLRITVVQ